jgi:hypothetical protein
MSYLSQLHFLLSIFNMSNLFAKIYNMLYYTTNLYLQ